MSSASKSLQTVAKIMRRSFISYVTMAKELTNWRNSTETPCLKEAPCHSLQHSLKDLERSFKNFFAKRTAFPRFKKKGDGCSFRYPDPKQIKLDQENSRIFLPKLGWMSYRNSRKVVGELRNVTVSESAGDWFVSIQTFREEQRAATTATTAVGIYVGIARFTTMSDGSYIEPLSSFKKHSNRLVKYQRKMSRKVKFSNNWKKAKSKPNQEIAELYQKLVIGPIGKTFSSMKLEKLQNALIAGNAIV